MLFETSRAPVQGPARSLLFHSPVEWLEVHQLAEVPALFRAVDEVLGRGLWVAGYLSYECGYHWESTACPGFRPAPGGLPLACFGVYREPEIVPVPYSSQGPTRGLEDVRFSVTPPQFRRGFNRIQQWIASGDTYQVNLTSTVEGTYPHDAACLFSHMMETQPVDFGAMLHIDRRVLLSASPELFFHLRERHITVRPMKGTAPRGASPAEDEVLTAALVSDEKNRAENIMIVDLLRSDLGRAAVAGSVRVAQLFAVERYPFLLQMVSEVEATLRDDVSTYQLFASLFPSGSIVGAPKVRTMQLIRELEMRDRGAYTGAIGFFSPHREAMFSVAIRTVVHEGEQVSMGVGSGITADSDAASEYAECLLKARFLRDRSFSLIETMRWENGHCALLARHIDRIAASAKHFHFCFDRAAVLAAIELQGHQLLHGTAWKLRVTVDHKGVCSFSPAEPVANDAEDLFACLWPKPVASVDLWLRHKTTRRAVYEQAAREARRDGYVDAIFVNEHGMVTEGATHSIFVRHGQRWRTPPLSSGVLPGVYRGWLLASDPSITEQDIPLNDLWISDEICLTNAVRGRRRVMLQASP